MSLEWVEGWGWLADSETSTALENYLNERYESSSMDTGTNKGTIEAGSGPSKTLKFGDDGANDLFVIKTPSNPTAVYVSFKFRVESSVISSADIVQLRSDASNLEISAFGVSQQGSWRISRNSGSANHATGAIPFRRGRWYHAEFYTTVHNTTGALELRINGVSIYSESNVDTRPTGASAHVDDIVFRNVGSGSDTGVSIRDLIIINDDGSTNNTWMGVNKQVYTLTPNADSSIEDWAHSSGTDSYALIDDISHDSGTSYIESTAAADVTLCEFTATGGESGISGISLNTTAALDAAGSETFDHVVRHGVTSNNGSANTVSSTTYAHFQEMWDTNPVTGVAWTSSDLDALQAGVEKN